MEKEETLNLLRTIAQGIARTFGSQCETLIQDLSRPDHPILAIYNGNVSGRRVGSTEDIFGKVSQNLDPTWLQQDFVNMLVIRGDKRIKSTTLMIHGENFYLGLGINLDVTLSTAYAEHLAETVNFDNYLDTVMDTAFQGRLEDIFQSCVQELGLSLEALSRDERIALVKQLKQKNAFTFQRAVPFISKRLGVSRYTIYKYLRENEQPPK